MPSPAEPDGGATRRSLERAARVISLGLLAWLLAQSLRGLAPDRVERVAAGSLAAALPRWSTTAPPTAVHLKVGSDLSPAARDWLSALSRSGARISWEAAGVLPLAATAEPAVDPAGGTRVLVAAPSRTLVTLADRFGPLDSIPAGPGGAGAAFMARSAPTTVIVRGGVLPARAAVADSLRLGRILVVGRVGWESKFVIAALEERGWGVDARLGLAPKGAVWQGNPVPIDTSRYAAVIVLDTAGLRSAPAIVAYVRSGGGAIVTLPAGRLPGLGGLGGFAVGVGLPATEPFDTGAEPRQSLAATPIMPAPDQLALERRGRAVTVAALRLERGRVLALGYQDTWRWRLAGGGDAMERHRAWWADLVASVAYAGRVQRPVGAGVDEAPLVHLIEALGPPAAAPPPGFVPARVPPVWLFGALLTLLLVEWTSRRLRGAA